MQKIAHYEVIEVIGDGGMGTVYKARDPRFDRMVAIKVLHEQFQRDPAVVERFKNEAIIQAKLSHPNIVTVYDFVATNEILAMVMEFVKGSSLSGLITQQAGPMPTARIVALMGQILSAMDHAHSEGLVHRDLKPSNIAVQALGDEEIAKVMDFGIAKVLGSEKLRTATGATMGTIHYASPEQLRSPKGVDHRTDIYALGVILYEMASGTLPFEAESEFELMRLTVEAPPPPLRERAADVPEALEKVVARALAKDPEQRYSSCREMLEALRSATTAAALQTPQPAAETEPAPEAAPVRQRPQPQTPAAVVMPGDDDEPSASDDPSPDERRPSTKKKLIAVAAAVVLVIAIGLTLVIQGKRRAEHNAADDRSFSEAVESGTEQPFRRYLETHGDEGRHSDDATRMLAAIEEDKKAYLIARDTGTIEGYQRYLARTAEDLAAIEAHRRSIVARLAEEKRQIADDDRRFEVAQRTGTLEAYCRYLEAARRGATTGRHAEAAQRAVDRLGTSPESAAESAPPEAPPPSTTLFRIVRVAADDVLHVRAAPNPSAAKVGEIPPDGTGIEWRGEKGAFTGRTKTFDWYRVTYRGVTGWVNSHFLERQ